MSGRPRIPRLVRSARLDRTTALLLFAFLAMDCGGDPSRIHDPASLPRTFAMCGRNWVKDSSGRQPSLDTIRTTVGVEPIVVDPGLMTPCPAGPCATAAAGPCHTVVWVRVGEDAYLAYELSGGP